MQYWWKKGIKIKSKMDQVKKPGTRNERSRNEKKTKETTQRGKFRTNGSE